jgi:hypothetical protein
MRLTYLNSEKSYSPSQNPVWLGLFFVCASFDRSADRARYPAADSAAVFTLNSSTIIK